MARDPKLTVAERKLAAAQDRARRTAMGKPLGGTAGLADAALEQAAVVGEADAALAEAQWDRDVPELAGLLDATVQERS